MSGREVRVFDTAEGLAEGATAIVADICNDAVNTRGRCMLAISGGSTPLPMFRLLASDAYAHRLDWQHIHIFWADERCVPPEHPDSNFGAAFAAFLGKVPIPPDNIHGIKGELSPGETAKKYEEELRSAFGTDGVPVFDLILLGMGADGHTASLFPGTPVLDERNAIAAYVYLDWLDSYRVTLTLPVINSAMNVAFLVSGAGKAPALRAVLSGGPDERYPASLVDPANDRVVWLLDKSAAPT